MHLLGHFPWFRHAQGSTPTGVFEGGCLPLSYFCLGSNCSVSAASSLMFWIWARHLPMSVSCWAHFGFNLPGAWYSHALQTTGKSGAHSCSPIVSWLHIAWAGPRNWLWHRCPWSTRCLVLLNLFNAEMSRKKHWRGPRYQEVGEEGVRKSHSVARVEFEKRTGFHSDSGSDSGYCLLTWALSVDVGTVCPN